MIKPALLLLSIATLSACTSPAPQPDIRALCIDTVNAYAHVRDEFDAERAAALFTEDASVTIFGQTQTGRDGILAGMKARSDGALSRHFISSIVIRLGPDSTATGENYFTVLTSADRDAKPAPLTEASFFAAGKYVDTYRIEDGQCRIATRDVKIDFQQP